MKQIVFLLACLWSLDNVSAAKQNLYVGGLFELSGHWFADYVNFFVQIFEHAFEEIENRTDLLADYSLKLITKDTQVMLSLCGSKSINAQWTLLP